MYMYTYKYIHIHVQYIFVHPHRHIYMYIYIVLLLWKTIYQNSILSVFAISSVKQTNVEKPSELPLFLISQYCGTQGTTPPNTMALAAKNVATSCTPRFPGRRPYILSQRASIVDWILVLLFLNQAHYIHLIWTAGSIIGSQWRVITSSACQQILPTT